VVECISDKQKVNDSSLYAGPKFSAFLEVQLYKVPGETGGNFEEYLSPYVGSNCSPYLLARAADQGTGETWERT
jgi:hypothetical protein